VRETTGRQDPIAMKMIKTILSLNSSPLSSPSSTPDNAPLKNKKLLTLATRNMFKKGRKGQDLNAPNPGTINAHQPVQHYPPTMMRRDNKVRKKRRRNISHNANR
jgi:hypothetical protein